MAHREWSFIHLSRMPAPLGLVDPETCVDTPLYEYGGNIYRKLYGTSELAQAMLCHTDHASRIADPAYVFSKPYDDQFTSTMVYHVYPSVIQRRTERETSTQATPFFSGGVGLVLRNVCFEPTTYMIIDFINAHGGWVTVLLLPVIIIACLTGDLAIAAWCFVGGFIICWSLGFR